MWSRIPSSPRSFRVVAGCGLVCVGASTGCEIVTVVPVPVGEVIVSPAQAAIFETDSLLLTVAVTDGDGTALTDRPVTWSAVDASVATVDQAGNVMARSPGSTGILATSETVTGVAIISIEPRPAVGLSDTRVDLTAPLGSDAPPEARIEVVNLGGGTLEGLTATVRYPPERAEPWLTARLDGPEAPTVLELRTDPSGLVLGSYEAVVEVASDEHSATIDVRLVVVEPPAQIGANQRSLFFQADVGGSVAPQSISISNTGSSVSTGLAATVQYEPGTPAGWISAVLSRTTAPATVEVSVFPAPLGAGTYRGTVTITADSGDPLDIAVVLVVVDAPPAIQVDPSAVSFQAVEGGPIPNPEVIQITNGGGGELDGLSSAVTYAEGGTEEWLEADLADATAPTTVTLRVLTTEVPEGLFRANVRIEGRDVPALVVNVEYHVDAAADADPPDLPSIGLSQSAVSVSGEVGEGPFVRSLDVTNVGGGALTGLGVQVTYDPGQPVGWTSAVLAGTSAPTQLEITLDAGGLAAGDYGATVEISAESASGTETVDVDLTLSDPVGDDDDDDDDGGTTAPAAPSDLSLDARGARRMDIDWTDNSDNEDRFELERRRDDESEFALLTSLSADTESYRDSGLDRDTVYHYRVRACNAAGCSDYSNTDEEETGSG